MYRFVENFIEENHMIQPGDTVIVVTTIKGLNALEDILR